MIYLGVYQDWTKACYTVNRLINLTNERIFIKSDGNYHPTYGSYLLNLSNRIVLVRSHVRQKVRGSGGAYTQSWMQCFLSFFDGEDYLIKVDPDTGINHAPILPDAFDVACNYIEGSLRGGAIALSKVAIQTIIESGLLKDEKYKELRWCYRWRNTEWIPCEDAILYDVIQRLNLNLVFWDDVYCTHADEPFNPPNLLSNYSLYHPL